MRKPIFSALSNKCMQILFGGTKDDQIIKMPKPALADMMILLSLILVMAIACTLLK